MGDTPFFESELFAELSEDLKASSRGADGRMSV